MDEKLKKEILDWLKTIVFAFVIAMLIKTFLFEIVSVDGNSMYPTLHNGEKLIANRLVYRFEKPQRGDIIIFRYPSDPKWNFIKRVIAVEGDSVEIKNGKVLVNNREINEPYINEMTLGYYKLDKVPQNTVFVLGDNRNNSKDSRFPDVGPVPLKNIVGKAVFRIFPFTRFGIVK